MSAQRSVNAPIRVLIVDDEQPVRSVLTSYLQKFGYLPMEATNAEEARRALESEQVDIVISDNQMPGMSGVNLFRLIEEKYPDLVDRFLLITGTKYDEEVASFCRASRAAFLEKPFQLREISAILEGMVTQLREASPAN